MTNPTRGWDSVPIFGFYFAGDDNTPTLGTVQAKVDQRITRVDGRKIYSEGAVVERTIGNTTSEAATRDRVRAAWRDADQLANISPLGGPFVGADWDAWWNIMLTGAVFLSFPASDDPDIVQKGYKVTVTERLNNGKGKTYVVQTLLSQLALTPPGINLGSVEVPPGTPSNPSPIYAKGLPGGIAALDADGDVVDAYGVKVKTSGTGTGGGGGFSVTDNGDGTLDLVSASLVDNGDGTLSAF